MYPMAMQNSHDKKIKITGKSVPEHSHGLLSSLYHRRHICVPEGIIIPMVNATHAVKKDWPSSNTAYVLRVPA